MRGIHAAQDALAAAGTIPIMDGAADTPPARSASLEMSSSKRKKTVRTYESSSKRSKTLAHDNGPRSSLSKRQEQAPQSGEVPWLPPTLQADFAANEPQMMFSEPSSTVPNNTMTQQQMIQQALEANVPVATASTQNKSETQNSDSSIPWSAYKEAHQSLPASSRTHPRDVTMMPQIQPASNEKRRSQTYAHSTRSSQTPLRASHNEDISAMGAETESPSKAPTTSARSRRSKTSTPQDAPEVVVKPVALLSEIEIHDSPSKTARNGSITNSAAKQPKRRKKSVESSERPEPTSDELWIGIPKEQYKPRASRSRSARVTNDEYLLAVQQTLQPKSKRRKLTVEQQDHREQPLDTIESRSASANPASQKKTSAQTEKSSPSNDPPVVEADPVEDVAMEDNGEIDANKENEAPGAMSPPSSAKVPRPPSRPVLVEVAIPAPAPTSTNTNAKRKRSVEPEKLTIDGTTVESPVLKPTPKTATASTSRKKTKARRSQTAATPGFSQRRKVFDSDDSESEISPVKSFTDEKSELIMSPAAKDRVNEMPPAPAPAIAEKRKGRGRPRKDGGESSSSATQLVKLKLSDEVMEDMQESLPNGESSFVPDDEAPNEPLVDEIPTTASRKAANTKTTTPPASTPEQQQKTKELEMKTPEAQTKSKGSANHSPISKGKVPYRVGLSRRSRIAPLLKIMKK